MRIEEDIKLDYKDVLIRPKRSTLSSRSEVDIRRSITFRSSGQSISGIPIVAANMDGVGTFAMARALLKHKMFVALHKHYDIKDLKRFFESLSEHESPHVFYTMGIGDSDVEKLDAFLKISKTDRIKSLCIDVANGYTERFVAFAKYMRARFPEKIIMAGNVVTGEIVEELALAGVDIIKVGIGPGSVCTTRKMTGVGYPQLSAVIECADAAHGIGAHICADGGAQVPGDVGKALGAGGDFVMIGSMLSAHKESEEPIIKRGGKQYVQYCGSSSTQAMHRHVGKVASYRASEGKCVEVPYKGPVENTLQDILGGLRSACTYVGARRLKELTKRTTFVRVSQQLNPQYDDL